MDLGEVEKFQKILFLLGLSSTESSMCLLFVKALGVTAERELRQEKGKEFLLAEHLLPAMHRNSEGSVNPHMNQKGGAVIFQR